MKKHILAIAAILLILAATACTQYQYDWEDFFPGGKTITTEEDLLLFLLDNGSKAAKVNVTIDPDSDSFPVEVRGRKEISGRIDVTESREPVFFSSATTPPGSISARAASGKDLFVVESGARFVINSLSINVDESAAATVKNVISVNGGSISGEGLDINLNGVEDINGLYIGETTAASNVSISNSNPGKIDFDENNTEAGVIFENLLESNPDIEKDNTPAIFDVNTASQFTEVLNKYGYVRLTDNIEDLREFYISAQREYTIDLNGKELTINLANPINITKNQALNVSNGNLNVNLNSSTNPEQAVLCLNGGTLNFSYVNLSTNAKDNSVSGIEISIDNSTVKSNHDYGTALLFNIDGKLNISNNSVLEAGAQALIVRGGTAEVNDSRIISRGTYVPKDPLYDTYWSDGNSVAVATVVVGNLQQTSGYKYETRCDLTNSEIELKDDAKYSTQPDVFVASTDYNVHLFIDEPYASSIIEESMYRGSNVYLNSEDTALPANIPSTI